MIEWLMLASNVRVCSPLPDGLIPVEMLSHEYRKLQSTVDLDDKVRIR
jgi:hypothetical protein